MVRNFIGLVAPLLAVAACQRAGDRTSTQPADRGIDAAEAFVDAFYSFERGRLESILAAARESAPEIIYYQGWAEGGNYEIVSRAPCKRIRPETVSCSITVKDDLIGALGIDFNVTDTLSPQSRPAPTTRRSMSSPSSGSVGNTRNSSLSPARVSLTAVRRRVHAPGRWYGDTRNMPPVQYRLIQPEAPRAVKDAFSPSGCVPSAAPPRLRNPQEPP
jgi:hypothetical protein